MDKPVSITRRRMLVGAAVASVAVAVPAAAIASAAPSVVMDAIAAHKAAMRHLRKCNRELDRLRALPGYQSERVQVGNLIRGFDDKGERVTQPIYAYTHDEIDAHYGRHIDVQATVGFGARVRERTEAQREAAHKSLRRIERANKRRNKLLGITAAIATEQAAYDAENRAAVALILARPASEAELKAKAAYMGNRRAFGSDMGREWWASEDRAELIYSLGLSVA